MFWNIQKFNKEIQALKALKLSERADNSSLARVKTRVMLSAAQTSLPKSLAARPVSKHLFRYVIATLLGLGLLGGTAFASENSLPGEFLYLVKRAKETVETSVAVSSSQKANVEAKHAEARLKELEQLTFKEEEAHGKAEIEPLPIFVPAVLPEAAINTSTPTTTQATIELEPEAKTQKPKTEKQIKAKAEAEVQVEKALKALWRAEEKLKEKKQEKARQKIEDNIKRLKEKAVRQGLRVEAKKQEDINKVERGEKTEDRKGKNGERQILENSPVSEQRKEKLEAAEKVNETGEQKPEAGQSIKAEAVLKEENPEEIQKENKPEAELREEAEPKAELPMETEGSFGG